MKVAYFAALRQPKQRDGVRRWRVASIRDTYRQVWRATIPSWEPWFPRTMGDFRGSEGGPATHSFVVPHPGDGGPVEIEIRFMAIGDSQIEDILRGFEVSAFHLGEADLLHPSVLTYCRGRVGRFPSHQDGGVWWPGVVMEYNAPDIDNYLYKLLEEDRPEGHRLFRLPSGLSPNAENLNNLAPGYYTRQIAGAPDWYVRRMIKNEYGYSRDGKPVYEHDYNDDFHCAKQEFEPLPGIPIQVGVDAGGTPAAILGQTLPNGQIRFFDEVVAEGGFCGAVRFANLLKDALGRYPGFECAGGRADPSAMFGVDKTAGELEWINTVAHVAKIRLRPASTNKLGPRIEALRVPMSRVVDGQPGLLVSPRCRVFRKGMNSGYRYLKKRVSGDERYDPYPDKGDPTSHVVDAAQYYALDNTYDAMRSRTRSMQETGRVPGQAILSADEDDVLQYGGGRPGRFTAGDAEL